MAKSVESEWTHKSVDFDLPLVCIVHLQKYMYLCTIITHLNLNTGRIMAVEVEVGMTKMQLSEILCSLEKDAQE